ncbi:hypothetical protein [Archangium sp.]|uniref:hypothetical protein n=1 Tax=Archangium sp. TaxID=1872627 RepID=UPI002D75C964|nr:hypothetical protein [Archangium sp.]HYO57193.1 hypothetical protein [Archangium sp.]
MAHHFEIIVDRDVSLAEALHVAERMRAWFIERKIIEVLPLGWNPNAWMHRPGPAYPSTLKEPNPHGTEGVRGLYFKIKRAVFWDSLHRLTCRACGARFEPKGESWEQWRDAAEDWLDGDDSVPYTCPGCGVPERLVEWEGEAPWGFGHLGIGFWGWTPLSERFIQEVTKQLGHRTVVVHGTL